MTSPLYIEGGRSGVAQRLLEKETLRLGSLARWLALARCCRADAAGQVIMPYAIC